MFWPHAWGAALACCPVLLCICSSTSMVILQFSENAVHHEQNEQTDHESTLYELITTLYDGRLLGLLLSSFHIRATEERCCQLVWIETHHIRLDSAHRWMAEGYKWGGWAVWLTWKCTAKPTCTRQLLHCVMMHSGRIQGLGCSNYHVPSGRDVKRLSIDLYSPGDSPNANEVWRREEWVVSHCLIFSCHNSVQKD